MVEGDGFASGMKMKKKKEEEEKPEEEKKNGRTRLI